MAAGRHIKTGHRILVVDDDRRVLNFLRLKLVAEGNEVVTAMNGPDALAAIESQKPEILVIDIAMPGISGLDVLRILRSSSSDLPVIVMSAATDLASEALRLEANSFVPKPFDPDDLVNTIESILDC